MKDYSLLIADFYEAFRRKDYKCMQQCYSNDARFNDPVFQNLDAHEVKAMWEMLCLNAKDFELTYNHVKSDGEMGRAEWIARYTFSTTGKKVINRIKSTFNFKDGKIIEHKDDFNFYSRSSQALGLPGIILGWTPVIKRKVRMKARRSLEKFMESNGYNLG